MKSISCGIIITDGRYVLMGRAGGSERFDIPKGMSNLGETDQATALRELKEEFGVELTQPIEKIVSLGLFEYNRNKSLELFLYPVKYLDISYNDVLYIDDQQFKLHCASTYQLSGVEYPEVDAFTLLTFEEMETHTFDAMQRLWKRELRDRIEDHLYTIS